MILSDRLSPSALTTLDQCEMKWFLNYVLGYREPSGEAATLGTAAHDVLEGVALSKLYRDSGENQRHRVFGDIEKTYDLDDLCERSFEYHKNDNPHLKWGKKQRKEVFEYVYKTKDHRFFPENHHEIVSPEQYFREAVDRDWAKFASLEDGEIVKGQLKIAGKIDIVFRDETGKLNYLDYKFGKRGAMDWAKMKQKNFSDMKTDIQLCLYYWAAKKLYPNEDPITHIWYVNTDTVWTDSFTEQEEEYAMNRVEEVFSRIRTMEKPIPKYGRHCGFCPFKKTSMKEWGKENLDIIATGSEKFAPVNDSKSCCDAMKYFTDHRSLPVILENCKYG